MDRITTANLAAFRDEQSLPASMDQSVVFEHFVNYCILTDEYDDEFDITDVHTGGGADLAIDGLAIIVNGVLIDSIDAAEELLATNGFLDVRFIFNQAKTGSGFSGEEIVGFGDGVFDFFAEKPGVPMSPTIIDRRGIMGWLYDKSSAFKTNRPVCELNFVTTGSWQDDPTLLKKIAQVVAKLNETNLFERVRFTPLGASELQASWSRSKSSVTAEFTFINKATLADIPGVKESYLGVLPLVEFLKVVAEPDGSIRKQIFFDNVRDFQGDNPVNGEIAESLSTEAGRDRFAVLNNGITLVARELKIVGNKFEASDFQVVNGCQTSHVLYNNREQLPDDMDVPFKVISTDDEEVIGAIATATNRQTQVTEEDLYALEGFQKRIEAYFDAFPEKHRVFYERRSKQFSSVAGIEKVRIITKQQEIRAFGAMFLDDAHRAARYYAALKSMVPALIFNPGHKVDPYYTAAFGHYKLEYLFRNGQVPVSYKPARHHLLMAFRILAGGKEMPAMTANKIEGYANKVNEALWDDKKVAKVFIRACDVIDSALAGEQLDGDAVKVQSFTDKVLAAL